MSLILLGGNPKQLGIAQGEKLRSNIEKNVQTLVRSGEYGVVPIEDGIFLKWMQNQEDLVGANWPWLIEEMRGISEGSGVDYLEILKLNFRAWQYESFGATGAGCSSVAITLSDGTIACGGALDDPVELYCGPVKFAPSHGFRFITFPITGTVWGNRGMNSEGLSIGISSQRLPGLKHLDNAVNQDVAMRVILQTCSSVGEVREFCKTHPFTMNLVCVDSSGDLLCAHHTAAGFFEMDLDGACALTNHISDERIRVRLNELGLKECPEHPNTRQRLDNLLGYISKYNRKCTEAEVMRLLERRDDSDPGSINNKEMAYITYSNPQVHKNLIWIGCHVDPADCSGFTAFSI